MRAGRVLGGLVALVIAAVPVAAQVSGEGHFYDMACNASGYVLTSRHPVGRFFGSGAGMRISEGRETLYLGASCDAAREGWNGGRWCWANGGFVVEFDEYRIGFPRQEPVCPEGVAAPTELECGC